MKTLALFVLAFSLSAQISTINNEAMPGARTKINANFLYLDTYKAPKADPTFTGTSTHPFAKFGPRTIGAGGSQIPAAGFCSGCITIVTDAASSSDCTSGGGSSVALCRSTGSAWASIGGGGGGTWGSITGTLSAQTDLNTALGLKASSSAATTVNGQTCTLGSTCTLSATNINTGTLPIAQVPSGPKTRAFGYTFNGGGAALTAGVTGYVTVPFACTISAWNIAVDTGTATVDIWKIATGTAIPTVSNTITASAVPAIATGTAIHSTTLTSWTTSVTANDIVGINLKVVATATVVNLTVECGQ